MPSYLISESMKNTAGEKKTLSCKPRSCTYLLLKAVEVAVSDLCRTAWYDSLIPQEEHPNGITLINWSTVHSEAVLRLPHSDEQEMDNRITLSCSCSCHRIMNKRTSWTRSVLSHSVLMACQMCRWYRIINHLYLMQKHHREHKRGYRKDIQMATTSMSI